VIERFCLPDFASAIEGLVNAMSRSTFDGPQNFGQAEGVSLSICQWSEYQVDMVWHNCDAMDLELQFVVMQAMLENQTP
jgi:hypothetical protein